MINKKEDWLFYDEVLNTKHVELNYLWGMKK